MNGGVFITSIHVVHCFLCTRGELNTRRSCMVQRTETRRRRGGASSRCGDASTIENAEWKAQSVAPGS